MQTKEISPRVSQIVIQYLRVKGYSTDQIVALAKTTIQYFVLIESGTRRFRKDHLDNISKKENIYVDLAPALVKEITVVKGKNVFDKIVKPVFKKVFDKLAEMI